MEIQTPQFITKENIMTLSVHQQNVCVSPGRKTRSFWARIHDMIVIARQRQQLRDLEDHMLNDIGLSRHEAMTEAQKTLWDVPHHWHK